MSVGGVRLRPSVDQGNHPYTENMSAWTLLYLDRDYDSTNRFPNEPMPGSFRSWLVSVVVICTVMVPMYSWLIALIGKRFLNKEFDAHCKQKRFMVFILGNLVAALLHYIWMIATAVTGMDWTVCSWYGGSGALLYALSNYFLYETLYLRACALQQDFATSRSKFLLRLAYYGTKMYIGVVLICPLAFHGVAYFRQGICVQIFALWALFLNLIYDTSLSFMFLYLFWEPVHKMLSLVQPNQNELMARKMGAMVRKNLLWSSVAIFSTFVFMIVVVVINLKLASGETPDESYMQLFQWPGSAIDMAINSFSNLCITSKIWVPPSSRFLNSVFNRQHEITGAVTASQSATRSTSNTNDK